MPVVPHRFLFRFSFPVREVAQSATRKAFLDLDGIAPLPDLGGLDAAAPFATLRAGWNDAGLGFRLEVSGKKMPVFAESTDPTENDGLQLWIDTRNTQSIHRATRFCHQFAFWPIPNNWPKANSKNGGSAKAGSQQLAIALAKEDAPMSRAGLLQATSRARRGGYELELWIPAECLQGYDRESNPLLGFYYVVRDAELGEQFLTVGREFPFDHDPSLWSTLELTK
ncbi:MAG TPA: hypothetical protein VEI07_19390 [Planctomycetaceae bacterium]|nr:hypothetical protein [Planctomycetaceae bacterium]